MSTFALVHGSCQNAWVWHKVIPELESLGHRAVAMDLPLENPAAGASEYADAVVAALTGLTEPPVIVGHSMSGLVIPVVASRRPVQSLVFLAAAVPRIGVSLLDRFRGDESNMFQPDWPGKDPSKNRNHALHYVFHDCPPALAEEAISHLRPQASSRAATEIPPFQSWPDVPRSYIVCAEDRTINPVWSRWASRELLGVEPVEIPGGHSPFLSRPQLLAQELAKLAARELASWA
ncbi:MAG TPA: alpha/beta fold hydrolase [Candidatus Methylomirabilis sp.]|nr:alpha/beta fold hydrolase [Candidatus Methylomirabilis sp.]